MCELRLLACVKDLLSRLLSPIFVRWSGFSLFYSLLQLRTAIRKISHLLATSLRTFILYSYLLTLPNERRGLHFSVVSCYISLVDWKLLPPICYPLQFMLWHRRSSPERCLSCNEAIEVFVLYQPSLY